MKKKESYFVDVKNRKIRKGVEYKWNTLQINTNKLKWDRNYRDRCIQKFVDIINKRKYVKPVRIKYQPQKRRYFSSKINTIEPKEFISREEIKIIKTNEECVKLINEIKINI